MFFLKQIWQSAEKPISCTTMTCVWSKNTVTPRVSIQNTAITVQHPPKLQPIRGPAYQKRNNLESRREGQSRSM